MRQCKGRGRDYDQGKQGRTRVDGGKSWPCKGNWPLVILDT